MLFLNASEKILHFSLGLSNQNLAQELDASVQAMDLVTGYVLVKEIMGHHGVARI